MSWLRICAVWWAFLLLPMLHASPRDAAWAQVEEARSQGLPQTAIEHLEKIIAETTAEEAHGELLRAIGERIVLQAGLQGDRPEERIRLLEAELERLPEAMRPVVQTLLAHGYWDFYQSNRWRFLQRTQVSDEDSGELLTWDLQRILREIDRRFQAALTHAETLQRTPIEKFSDGFTRGNVPDRYRPTLYDVLAHEALTFYAAGEQGAVAAEDVYVLQADSPIFADVESFLAWELPDANAYSPVLRALGLYQKLLRFHRDTPDRSAFFDLDLARLHYGHNHAAGDDKDERYATALQRLQDATAGHEIESRILAQRASLALREDQPEVAWRLATQGIEAHPGSAGASRCRNLRYEIEKPELAVDTERVWNAPWPKLNFNYRNLAEVHVRAVKLEYMDWFNSGRRGGGIFGDYDIRKVLDLQPTREWLVSLPATADYRTRSEASDVPTDLPPGFYAIVASTSPDLRSSGSILAINTVWVSRLALVIRLADANSAPAGLVVDGATGEPVVGARVHFLPAGPQSLADQFLPEGLRLDGPVTTDRNGRFDLPPGRSDVFILARHGDHAVASEDSVRAHRRHPPPEPSVRSTLFTDRAIYRPGQTIHYKGISVQYASAGSDHKVVPGHQVTVVLTDPQGQEIGRARHRTNDFGSFSGSFIAPTRGLTGEMELEVEEDHGSATIRVEEYKRPKFQVHLHAPGGDLRLGENVAILGRAVAYSGAAMSEARVEWRVQREVRLPPWCWWWRPNPPVAVAHGTTEVAQDGTFTVNFVATPDANVPPANEPVFNYVVYADVTDATGETRSQQRSFPIGYAALQARLSVAEWQTVSDPVALEVRVENLAGEAQRVAGNLAVHRLQAPDTPVRAILPARRYGWSPDVNVDPSDPRGWELGPVVGSDSVARNEKGSATTHRSLEAGAYRAVFTTTDAYGQPVTAHATFLVVDPSSNRLALKVPNYLAAPRWSLQPGETFRAVWGTGYDAGRAYVEWSSEGRVIASYWTAPGRTQHEIMFPITEQLRGGATLSVSFVRDNRAYLISRVVQVPWTSHQLDVRWERFRSKLEPGAQETWTAIVSGPQAERVTAEMVATLYDASLDQFEPHSWPSRFFGFRQEREGGHFQFSNSLTTLATTPYVSRPRPPHVSWQYRTLLPELRGLVFRPGTYRGPSMPLSDLGGVVTLSPFEVQSDGLFGYATAATLAGSRFIGAGMKGADEASAQLLDEMEEGERESPGPFDWEAVSARRNLQETAFFFSHLQSDRDGVVRLQFTMPEALTEWQFMGFAHDVRMRSGLLTDQVVTTKDLMVQPNPPRFLREGDVLEFTVKVSNQGEQAQAGQVRLSFADAITLEPVDAALEHAQLEQPFAVPAGESRSYRWRIRVPDGLGVLIYKVLGASATVSDGEEGYLPVLSRRVLVTESLPLPIRGPATRTFSFDALRQSADSASLQHQALTVQMVSQPAWYAVMALPYLMEFPYDCSEQLFNRLYANALAQHVANADPKIRRVFDRWRETDALESPLEKNPELRSVLLEETPWLRQARSETESRRRVGVLFDENRLRDEQSTILARLAERQRQDGRWAWFPGGEASDFITLYLATGFGRLRHLGVSLDAAPAIRSVQALDAWMVKEYRRIQDRSRYTLGSLDAFYLYARSFFLEDVPVADEHRRAVEFYLERARQDWVGLPSRQNQAHVALALHRWGDVKTPQAIVRSLQERALQDEEMGMYWDDRDSSWWWYRAPIETQAMMIEALAEITQDHAAVAACQTWLLKQKQTQSWRTTKATADAVYSLLLRGQSLLGSDAVVAVDLGTERVEAANREAGTGFYEHRYHRSEIRPEMGEITVTKTDAGVSWGSVHWQYLEDVAQVKSHVATPLQITKSLWVKVATREGQVLKPVQGSLAVGDELVVRLEIRTDRDLEFVHLKDQRGSGTEPVNVLSQYKVQDGLWYYESTRDTASHFFIDYLRRGTYVFEYSVRVQLQGQYESGFAEIQCMYAPEFNSRSESTRLEVGDRRGTE
jgi:uncharacterized protein YfaS (alpha-2-macroglobulin family)